VDGGDLCAGDLEEQGGSAGEERGDDLYEIGPAGSVAAGGSFRCAGGSGERVEGGARAGTLKANELSGSGGIGFTVERINPVATVTGAKECGLRCRGGPWIRLEDEALDAAGGVEGRRPRVDYHSGHAMAWIWTHRPDQTGVRMKLCDCNLAGL